MRSAPVRPPSGSPSSAGWKKNITVPGNLRPHLAEELGDAKRDRNVGVVAAGMLDVGDRGFVWDVDQLGDRQCVHVGADRHQLPRASAFEDADHAGDADAGAHLVELQRAEAIGDERRRPRLAEPQLGMTVDVAPALDQRRPHRRGRRVDLRPQRRGDGEFLRQRQETRDDSGREPSICAWPAMNPRDCHRKGE